VRLKGRETGFKGKNSVFSRGKWFGLRRVLFTASTEF